MHEFWYNYVKPKYGEKGKLCNMDTDFVYRLLFVYILCIHENRWYLWIHCRRCWNNLWVEQTTTNFLSLPKNMGKNIAKSISKNVSGKQSATEALITD